MQDKLFYKIGEVATITKLQPYILRYWESEFNILSPGKSKTGRRLYEKNDIQLILEIKRLLYNEKFSIEGAKKQLERKLMKHPKPQKEEFLDTIGYLKKELNLALSILNHNEPAEEKK